MSSKKTIDVDDAYGLRTPDDNIALYRDWAATYDTDFIEAEGYVLHLRVAERLLRHRAGIDAAVLDVGCGTGAVGLALRAGGIAAVDGIDISAEMLAVAGNKKMPDGTPVYRELIRADLTQTSDMPADRYAALASAGTFTHGHLGPDCLDVLWRVAAPGALAVIAVRSTHYEALGFAGKLEADAAGGIITEPVLDLVGIYAPGASASAHARDEAQLVICRVR